MKRTLSITCGCALLCGLAFAFDATRDFKTFIKGMLPRVARAITAKNAKFLDAMSTADFTDTERGHTYARQQSMDQMKAMFAQCKSVKCTFKLISARAGGTTGIALVSGHMVAVLKPARAGDKTHTMVMDMSETETWVGRGNAWKLRKTVTSAPSKMTVDGKSVNGGR